MWGGPLLLYFPGKEPPHKEFLGSDPNWGDLGGISLCLCAFFALDLRDPPKRPLIGDKFGESLGGSQAPPSFWKVPRLPRKFPQLPQKFFGDLPGSSLTVNLTAIQGFPGSFPDFPRSSPKFPGGFPDFPGGQPLFLESLTPSLDSQKLPLI